MTENNPFSWAENAGKARAAKNAELRAKRGSEVTAEATRKQIAAMHQAEFRKKADEFIQTLSNQVQLAVNAFNREVGSDTQINAPYRIPNHGQLGLILQMSIRVSNPELPGMAFPPKHIQTTVEILTPDSVLNIYHLHAPGNPRDSARLEKLPIKVNASGEMIVNEGDKQIKLGDLVERICLPLFNSEEKR